MDKTRRQPPTPEAHLLAHRSLMRLSAAELLPLEREWRRRAARRALAREAMRP